MVAIEGSGLDAELMRSYYQGWNDPLAYAISHVGWGLHPGARWDALVMYDKGDINGTEFRALAGSFLISTGANEFAHRFTNCHFDLPMRNCTVLLDDVPVVRAGILRCLLPDRPPGHTMNATLSWVEGKPRLAFETHGSGPPLVFLHGIGGNRHMWRAQAEAFKSRFTVLCWDARGYGDSEDYDGPLDFSDFGNDLARLLDSVAVAKAHLVGLSMGARILMDFFPRYRDPSPRSRSAIASMALKLPLRRQSRLSSSRSAKARFWMARRSKIWRQA